MKKQTASLPQLQARAAIVSNSYNESERTIDVVFATETPVKRWNWDIGTYNEVLEISEAAIDFARMENGAPVLNTHSSYDVTNVLGVVERAWVDTATKEAKATLRLSEREDLQPIVNDIKAGIIRNISAGYYVNEYTVEDPDANLPIYRATKWQPTEISFVPVPADYNSGTRSQKTNEPLNSVIIKSRLMEENTTVEQQAAPAAAPATPAPAQTVDVAAERAAATTEERQRAATITDTCQRAGLGIEFANELISSDKPLSEARAAIIDKIAERSNKPPVNQNATVTGEDESVQVREAVINGLQFRSAPGSVDIKGNEKARTYANMRMLDLAKERLQRKGENFSLLSEPEIVKRALTTTDFPDLLTNTFNRTLLRFYEQVPNEWKFLARQENATDFREKTGITVDGTVSFEEIPESGEYKEAPILQNDKATIKLKKYGRKFSISDIAIINDDLSVFSRVPSMIALGAQSFQSDAVWSLLINNAKTPDNVALFNAAHKNLGTAGVIDETSISAARTAMRRQKSPAGNKLGIRPKYLIVPPELETAASKFLTAVLATQTGDVNVFSNAFSLVVSDALEDPKAWYLAADPATANCEGLVYAYLSGQEGLKTENRVNWDTDSLEIKAHMAFATAAWGFQGWYKNPGA